MKRLGGKPEILAPAGSIESLKGAIAAGADAVYIGGNKFGARAYAENPEQDMLLAAIDYVHSKDRRIYLTVNTLLKEQELTKELYLFLEKYYRAGVDAVIVQDVGVLHFLASHFSELPVHASTQMTLVSADGAKMLSDYPVTRMVPARELSLEEIKTMRRNTALEIEAFVHGALCYCYSGQCLFSSMIGGRSGNRGRCAQPCRMAYTVTEDGRWQADGLYVLSPKDLCTLDRIPELVKAGINSFKIEGRMKRPEYTAGVTAAYRLLTDLYFEYGETEFYNYIEKHPRILEEQMDRVADLYNRGGFTNGYYVQYHGRTMMSMERPNHTGTKVGEVVQGKGIRAKIRLEKSLNPQDILEIRDASGEVYEFTAGKAGIEEKPGWYETNVKKGFPVMPGQPVYRTKNESLLKELREAFVEKQVQLPVKAEFQAISGQNSRLTVWCEVHQRSSLQPGADTESRRTVSVTVMGDEVLTAQNQPVTAEKIREQLKKTGESEFFFEELQVVTGDNIFLPVGKIKELRRNAFEAVKEEILKGYRRKAPKENEENISCSEYILSDMAVESFREQEVIVLVSKEEQCRTALEEERISTVYVDVEGTIEQSVQLCREVKQSGKRAYLVLPHIFREKEKKRWQSLVELVKPEAIDGFLAKSLEELQFLKETGLGKQFEIRLNYNLYAFQQEAKCFFRKKGFTRFTVPVELNEEEIRGFDVRDCDFIVYGRLPLMVSAQCVRDNVVQCSAGKKMEGIVLTDRMGAEFPVRQICSSCYNVIYNSACFSLLGSGVEKSFSPAGWRLDFTFEMPEQMKEVLNAFFAGTQCPGKGPYTKGHFKRGIE
ncbi:MAG: U32 family peptidase [Lachnospiraceae bacterium]|nr:U32 family peptidase [Lachnospiraceae bacterium]